MVHQFCRDFDTSLVPLKPASSLTNTLQHALRICDLIQTYVYCVSVNYSFSADSILRSLDEITDPRSLEMRMLHTTTLYSCVADNLPLLCSVAWPSWNGATLKECRHDKIHAIASGNA